MKRFLSSLAFLTFLTLCYITGQYIAYRYSQSVRRVDTSVTLYVVRSRVPPIVSTKGQAICHFSTAILSDRGRLRAIVSKVSIVSGLNNKRTLVVHLIPLNMQSVLDTEVSVLRNYNTAYNPRTINMLTWLRSTKHAGTVRQIRSIADKKQRDQLKATLPACTPSGVFTRRAEKHIVRHSGLLQIDIDTTGNEGISNYNDLKEELSHLDYMAYVGLSVSGKGFWGLVPLAYPERHKEQFAALEKDFAGWGITLDTKPKNVASLRGYSYDDNAYFNHSAVAYKKCYEEPQPVKVDVPRSGVPVSDPFTVAARTLEKQGILYQQGNRHDYLWQFARLCNRFGVAREDCQAYVDSVYCYDEKTNWLDSYRRYATEADSYVQESPACNSPTKPNTVVQTFTTCFGRKVTNQINEHGYPAFWDN